MSKVTRQSFIKIILLSACLSSGGIVFGRSAYSTGTPDDAKNTGTSSTKSVAQVDTQVFVSPAEVVVTAPRMTMSLKENPSATTVVGGEVLGTMPKTIGIEEAVRLVPGVKVDNQADGERVHVSIRGQGILSEHGLRGIKAILDGLPLNDPTGFTPDLYDVDWSTVDRLEVLRGPAASLYGGSASAGVINIITQTGGNSPLQGDLSTSYGSYNFWKTLGQFGATVDQVNYRVSLSRMMGDGYRDHTKYWANNYYGKLGWSPSLNVVVTPVIGWTDFFNENAEGLNLRQLGANPQQANGDAGPKNEYMQTSRFLTGLSSQIELTKNHEITSALSVRRTVYTESVPGSVLHRTMVSPGLSLQYTFHSGEGTLKNHLSGGADFQWQTIDQYKHPNLGLAVEGMNFLENDRIEQRGIGLFILDRVELNEQWNVTLSLRNDDIRNSLSDRLMLGGIDLTGDANFQKATARVGVTFAPTRSTSWYANWGAGFLPPATEELALNPDAQGGFNWHLSAATSQSEEVGFRGMFEKNFYADVAVYYMTTDNDFDRYRIPSRVGETFYRNSGTTRRFGGELYTRWIPAQHVTIQLAYTYSNFKYTMSTRPLIVMDDTTIVKHIENGNSLPNSPEHQISLDLQYEPVPDVLVGLSAEAMSRTYIDGANVLAESVEPFGLLHARVEYRTKLLGIDGTIYGAVRNLTDKQYVAFTEPDPGGNSYQPGSRREFFGGIKIGFGK